MKQYVLIFSVLFLMNTGLVWAQNKETIHLNIEPYFGNKKLSTATYYPLKNGDSIQVETFKFYISNIQLLNNNQAVYTLNNSYHLIDFSNYQPIGNKITIQTDVTFNQLKFQLGIDSLTNESGAMGGDLDPTKGMYWAWQSGYINTKIEGKNKSTQDKTTDFQFHLGGYLPPFNCLQTVLINLKKEAIINLKMDLSLLLNEIDFKTQHHIMSPSKETVIISEKASKIFSKIE